MFCTNCGKEIRDGAAFCPECGQALAGETAQQAAETVTPQPWQQSTETVTQQPPAKKSRMPLIIAGVAAAALLLVVAAVMLLRGGSGRGGAGAEKLPDGYVARTDIMSSVISGDETILFGLRGEAVTLEGGETDMYVGTASSLDASKAAIVTGDDMILYYVSDGEVTEVDDGVYGMWMSPDGSALAYCRGEGYYYEGQPLYLWHPGEEEGELISRDFVGAAVFSANGTQLLYSEMLGDEDYVLTLYDVKGGKGEEYYDSPNELVAVSVTDDASMVVFGENGESYSEPTDLYVSDGTKDTYLGQVFGADPSYWVTFNKDCSEMVFYDLEEGVRYHMDKTGKVTELEGDEFSVITPATTAMISQSLTRGSRFIYGIPTFAGTFYREASTDTNVYHIGEDFQAERLLRHATAVSQSMDGKTLYYRRDDGLYSLPANAESDKEETLLQELDGDTIAFATYSVENDIIYHAESDGALFYTASPGGEPEELTGRHGLDAYTYYTSSEFSYAYGYISATNTLLFIEDGVVYRSVAGGEPEEVTEVEGEGYCIMGNMRMGMTIQTHLRNTDAIYVTTDGTTFTLITDDADVHEPY